MKRPQSIQISIPQPCHEDWNKMTPQEQGMIIVKAVSFYKTGGRRTKFLILLTAILFTKINSFGQRITYANKQRDSVQIDSRLLDYRERGYKIQDIQLYVDGKRHGLIDKSEGDFLQIIVPKTSLDKQYQKVILRITHKTNQGLNVDFEINEREICDGGFCCASVIVLRKPLVNKFEGGNTRTITSDEIEKGAY